MVSSGKQSPAPKMDVDETELKHRREIEFWRDSEQENPQADSLGNIINKVSDAAVLVDCLQRHRATLGEPERVLELGGGQGWAACIFKRMYPRARVISTDISEYAVASVHKWERLWQVTLDAAYACRSYATAERDASLDVVFCFAAAHHFVAQRRTLREIARVLKPGGRAIYFYEPATPRMFYRFMHRRLNQQRPVVPEDVLITRELGKLAAEAGLDMQVDYFPSLRKRGPLETLYFFVLSRMPFLQRVLPASVNFVFRKP